MEKILDVRDLSIGLKSFRPVQNLSFSVRRGETLALVGESGSGKSLTALALMRLLPEVARIAGGSATFMDRDLASLSEAEMRKVRGSDIGMIFQEPMTSLNPVLTVGRQISEVLRIHEGLDRRLAMARSVELLDLVRIPEPQRRVHEYPHQLSGGMRQRVMIAMAVACSPKLLIADEPTTALDVTIQAQVLELIDNLCRDLSMAVILITHDLGVVGQWADRVVVMYAGRKVEEADPETLFSRPLHPYTRGLLGASPRMAAGISYRDQALVEIPGSIASATMATGCRFAPRCDLAEPSCLAADPDLLEPAAGHRVACPIVVRRGA
ncbi:MAG: ABC transporter ATP-binding protein [Rhizobiaceae bacterium]|nr:ABC transporter ATP-binding protein [Rhizobiaceae bacterium]